jgi:two-component system nitrogen regulation response regulator GlnG
MFRLALLAREWVIDRQTVDEELGSEETPVRPGDSHGFAVALQAWIAAEGPADGTIYHRALAELERPLFDHALLRTGGNQIAAARLLGINRNTLRKHLADLAAGEGRA